MQPRYRICSPPIVHETIDGEVVIINFATGAYYSCTEVAADAWEAIVAGASAEEIVADLTSRYADAGLDVAGDVARFLGRLEEEGIVEASTDVPPRVATSPAADTAGTYRAPELEKFTDMADLIVLDPVHDVTRVGWPHRQTDEHPTTP